MFDDNKFIGDNTFEGCERICRIFCLCSTPPKVSASSLPFVWWLIVLEKSFPLYKKAKLWKEFNFCFQFEKLKLFEENETLEE